MGKYLEYDLASGKIISEIYAGEEPESSEGFGILEVDEELKLDTTGYAVRGGALVKDFETNEERLERERLRRENSEKMRQRLKAIIYEYVIAELEEDEEAIRELREEYHQIKVYL